MILLTIEPVRHCRSHKSSHILGSLDAAPHRRGATRSAGTLLVSVIDRPGIFEPAPFEPATPEEIDTALTEAICSSAGGQMTRSVEVPRWRLREASVQAIS
jgi:hypothetical protein